MLVWMSDLAIGRTCRTLRRRLGWRQVDLAAKADISQSLVSNIERGLLGQCTVKTLRDVFGALETDLNLTARWRGGELDRVLDEDHAWLVAAIVRILRSDGWATLAEVTFSEYGERGSIDVLAWHAATRTLLVIEVKASIASTEETLRRMDVKVRLAPRIGTARFGSRPATVARLLVIGDTSTNRRRAVRLTDTGAFTSVPKHEVRDWLRRPAGSLASVMFLASRATSPGGSRRIRSAKDQAASQ
jgi:transcriptional regulator with XRE-family HTH domain